MKKTDQQIVHQCRHRFEWPLFALTTIISILFAIFVLGVTVFKTEITDIIEQDIISEYKEEHPENSDLDDAAILKTVSEEDKELLDTLDDLSLPVVLLAPFSLVLFMIYSIGSMYGQLRANGIQISQKQFPKVYAMWEEMAKELGFKTIPDLYVTNGNGALNAFATCVPGYRRFGAVYSDILERALANDDDDSLRFILGHELGHIRLGHVYWWYVLLTSIGNLPILNYFLGLPLSRAREYGCDKIGYHMANDQQCKGLMMLAAGKHLYKDIDLNVYTAEQIKSHNFWTSVYNFTSDHPNVNWRIAAILQNRHGDLIFYKKQ